MASCVQQVQSFATSALQIAADLKAGLSSPDLTLVILFFPCHISDQDLARTVGQAFAPVPVIGCSSSGEIGPHGYSQNSVVGIGLSAPDFQATTLLLRNLSSFNAGEAGQALQRLRSASDAQAKGTPRFAITLFDGLCLREEQVVSAIHAVLSGIPLCGGSAGDGLTFERSQVLYDGALHEDCVLVALITSGPPFHVFKTEHFVASDQRLVVTGADLARRIVTELNGFPAADEYARLTGCDRNQMTPSQFAHHPLLVRLGGANFVRSILRVFDDGSMLFACAIDVGLVLRLGHSLDMAANLEQTFRDIDLRIGPPLAILGFDCILRRLELETIGKLGPVGQLMADHHVLGFSTNGEQYQGMHINQTFTGVALGRMTP